MVRAPLADSPSALEVSGGRGRAVPSGCERLNWELLLRCREEPGGSSRAGGWERKAGGGEGLRDRLRRAAVRRGQAPDGDQKARPVRVCGMALQTEKEGMKARATCAVQWPREDITSETERVCQLELEIRCVPSGMANTKKIDPTKCW